MDYRSLQASGNKAPRILLVGDSGVGKTTFVTSLNSQLRKGAAQSNDSTYRSTSSSPTTPSSSTSSQSTIGIRCDAICVKYGGAIKAVDVVELGGNRTFHVDARSAAYRGSCAAVFLFYRPDSLESIVALGHWYKEIKRELLSPVSNATPAGDGLQSPPRFFGSPIPTYSTHSTRNPPKIVLVAVSSKGTDIAGWHATDPNHVVESSFLNGTPLEPAAKHINTVSRYFWHWLTVILSILLFGPGQKAVPYKLSCPQEVLRTIESDPCFAETLTLEYSPKEQRIVFGDTFGDVVQLLVTLNSD